MNSTVLERYPRNKRDKKLNRINTLQHTMWLLE
jgi:hypothetical protein